MVTNYEMIGDMEIGVLDVLRFAMGFIASLLLVTVACSDLLLSLFNSSFDRESELRDGPLYQALSDRLHEFEKLGLTDLQTGAVEFFEKMRDSTMSRTEKRED